MKTFHVQTLGCKVNHYESDQIAELLCMRGLVPVDAASADLRVINTCSVTTQAASQSRQSARRMVRLPVIRTDSSATSSNGECDAPTSYSSQLSAKPRSRVLVTGCWATSNPADASAIPGVDAVIGHHHDVSREIDRLLARWQSDETAPSSQFVPIHTQPTDPPPKQLGIDYKRKVEPPAPVGENTTDIQPKPYETVNRKTGAELAGEYVEIKDVRTDPGVIASKTAPAVGTTSLPLLNHRQPNRQRAFLKIQDGCDAHCTYCIIPTLRPGLWSKPIDDVVQEANALVAAGHVEIVLTGIFLGAYGQPTALRRRQARSTAKPIGELIDSLCTRVPGLKRLRLSSLEPGDLTAELIAILRSHPAVVPHFHLPLQSGSDALLRRMNRQYTRDDFLRMVERVNAAFDRPALTTDIVVGFPGETDAEFERTVEVARLSRFIHIHAFPYSPRPGTAAARWTKQFIRGAFVNERIEHLKQMAGGQSFAFRSTFVGETVEVIVERNAESKSDHPPVRHGRCERYFSVTLDEPQVQPGQTVKATILQVTRDETIGRVVSSQAAGRDHTLITTLI